MNKEFELKLGQNIRRIRESKQMTQEQLSAQMQIRGCDVTRSALAKIEVGQRHLYPDEIILLREILNTSFEEKGRIKSVTADVPLTLFFDDLMTAVFQREIRDFRAIGSGNRTFTGHCSRVV